SPRQEKKYPPHAPPTPSPHGCRRGRRATAPRALGGPAAGAPPWPAACQLSAVSESAGTSMPQVCLISRPRATCRGSRSCAGTVGRREREGFWGELECSSAATPPSQPSTMFCRWCWLGVTGLCTATVFTARSVAVYVWVVPASLPRYVRRAELCLHHGE